MIEQYIEEKFKIFDILSSGLLSKSKKDIIETQTHNNLIGMIPSMSNVAKLDHIINYVFRYIE